MNNKIFKVLKAIGLIGGIVCGGLALAGDIPEAKAALDECKDNQLCLEDKDASEESV